MLTSGLAKLMWLLYIGLILGDGVLSQGWMDDGFSNWDFMSDFDDFAPPAYSGWDFGFGNGLGGFFGRMMHDTMLRNQRLMRLNMAQSSDYGRSPEMERLLQDARSAFAAEDHHHPGFRRIVRTGSCGRGCHMRVVLTRDNGGYSERVYQTSS